MNNKTDTRHFIITTCADCARHRLEPDTNPLFFRLLCEETDRYAATEILPYDIMHTIIPEWCPKLKGVNRNGHNKQTTGKAQKKVP